MNSLLMALETDDNKENGGMDEMWTKVLEGFELTYYITFIILTGLLVWYAVKTYFLQAKKSFQILCKLCVISDIPGGTAKGFGVEIYNHGNVVKENLILNYQDKYYTTIDYIKPNEAVVIPLGTIIELPAGKNILSCNLKNVTPSDISQISLSIDGKVKQYKVNTDLLYSYHGGATALNDIVDALKDIGAKIEKRR